MLKNFGIDSCHDAKANHKRETPLTQICGYCSKEQPCKNVSCSSCTKHFTSVKNNNNYWQGGKGVRNKASMSNKDSHKFKDR